MTIAVLPASFDPITNGHVDIITRASGLFERLIVAVYSHPKKPVLFSLDERLEMVREATALIPHTEVTSFDGLLVDFCRRVGAIVTVRGLRALSDFEYEFQQAALNRRMMPELEVVSMFASDVYGFLSSSIIKEIAENGGDVSAMVPFSVAEHLQERFGTRRPPLVAGGYGH